MAYVDLESGFMERGEAPVEESQQEGGAMTSQPAASLESSSASRVAEVVQAALAGTLPLDEPLAVYEVKKFSPLHVSMVLDRCQGMKPAELVEKYDMNYQYVNIILRHPFARQLQQALLSQLADRCADPMERMKAYANEMIDVKMEIVRERSTPKQLRNAVASDILDRAGYGARQKVEVKDTTVRQPSVPAGLMGRLVSALEVGQRVASVDYSRHTAAPARKEDSDAPKVTPAEESGNSDSGLEASLEGSPAVRRIA